MSSIGKTLQWLWYHSFAFPHDGIVMPSIPYDWLWLGRFRRGHRQPGGGPHWARGGGHRQGHKASICFNLSTE